MADTELAFINIFEVTLAPGRSIVVSTSGKGKKSTLWFNEKLNKTTYIGFTQKGFGLKIEDAWEFILAVRNLASGARADEIRFGLGGGKELVVYVPAPNQVDMRQYIKSAKYTGFTKKGIRLVSSNAIKLTDELIKHYNADRLTGLGAVGVDQPRSELVTDAAEIELLFDDERRGRKVYNCRSCKTTLRPQYRDGYCEACYQRENREHNATAKPSQTSLEGIDVSRPTTELLEYVFSLHGKKCYVCQTPHNKLWGNLSVYYADGDDTNQGDDNIYPICASCHRGIAA